MWILKHCILISIVAVICEAGMTIEQLKNTSRGMRAMCMKKTKISDERVDLLPTFPPGARDLQCYTACMLEMMNTMRRGKVNYETAIKNIEVMMPDEFKASLVASLNACRDIPKNYKDRCEASYAVFECFSINDANFFFP